MPRTFPDHPFLCPLAGRQMLERVLLAYSLQNPIVGYCQVSAAAARRRVDADRTQAMNFLCAFLLLYMDERSAFWALSRVVEDRMAGYYKKGMVMVQVHPFLYCCMCRCHFLCCCCHFSASLPAAACAAASLPAAGTCLLLPTLLAFACCCCLHCCHLPAAATCLLLPTLLPLACCCHLPAATCLLLPTLLPLACWHLPAAAYTAAAYTAATCLLLGR